MKDIALEIAAIKKEIRSTPYHKATEHHIGRLRAKLAKLKKQAKQLKKAAVGYGFVPKKAGDATVVLIGPPSVGKSTLLNKLTQAHARVEPWPFTTLTVVPGVLKYKGANIQTLDLPGVIKGAVEGVGGGKEVLSVARIADLILLMVDIKNIKRIDSLIKDLKKLVIHTPLLVVINKSDLFKNLPQSTKANQIFISAETGFGLAELKEKIWQELKLIRVYLKPKSGKSDFSAPLILREGQTVENVIQKIFPTQKRVTQIFLWGPSARFPGQQVSVTHRLQDEDILTFA